jgi:hypothetical protein
VAAGDGTAGRLFAWVNRRLDGVVRPEVSLLRRPRSAFRVCGCIGLAIAVALALALIHSQGRSPWVMASIVVAAVATFLVLALATKIITGAERLVYYHHEIAVLLVAAAVARLWRQPVLPYLDATVLGVGAFLVCGRVGCFLVGCCHGRPASCGVRYGVRHATAGFPSCYVGVRLLPVQLVEAGGVLAIVSVGVADVIRGLPAGTALAWYVVAYDAGRYGLEFLRGDAERPYRAGFSSPQWVSPALTMAVVAGEAAGLLPWHTWHGVATGGLVATTVVIAIRRRRDRTRRHEVFQPGHVREIAEVLARLGPSQDSGDAAAHSPSGGVHWTSRGIGLSGQRLVDAGGWIEHYAISRRQPELTAAAARQVAALILSLRHGSGAPELVAGRHGVYHLLIRT